MYSTVTLSAASAPLGLGYLLALVDQQQQQQCNKITPFQEEQQQPIG